MTDSLHADSAVLAAYHAVLNSKNSAWTLYKLVLGNDSQSTLVLAESGENSLEGLEAEWDDDAIQLAFIRVFKPCDGEHNSSASMASKLVLVHYCPESAPSNIRMRFGRISVSAARIFDKFHLQIHARKIDELRPERIYARVFGENLMADIKGLGGVLGEDPDGRLSMANKGRKRSEVVQRIDVEKSMNMRPTEQPFAPKQSVELADHGAQEKITQLQSFAIEFPLSGLANQHGKDAAPVVSYNEETIDIDIDYKPVNSQRVEDELKNEQPVDDLIDKHQESQLEQALATTDQLVGHSALALYDFTPENRISQANDDESVDDGQLELRVGDELDEVIVLDEDWAEGRKIVDGNRGYFPLSYIQFTD